MTGRTAEPAGDRTDHAPTTRDDDAWHVAPVALLRTDLDGTVVVANRTLLDWLGTAQDDVVGRRLSSLLSVGGRIYWETHLGPLLRMQGGFDEVAVELHAQRRPAGRLPVLMSARVGADGIDVALSRASERSRYERELLAARTAAEVSAGALSTLQHVTAALSVASGVDSAARALLTTAVEHLGARSAALWLPDDRGALRRHRPAGGRSVTEPGRPPARRLLQGPAQPRPDGSVVVPLRAPDRPAGALVLTPPEPVAATEWPPDVDLLTALGQQAGVALARAAMQDRSASVAHELQHALLTTDVPDDDRFGVTTIYRPGVQALEVGGDWYDVFLVRDGVLAVAVGDVVGRGLHAAAAMGQLRSAVRAVADEDGPVGVLARLDRFVERTGVGFMATLAYAELDLATGLVRYACAGHMPPLLLGEETTLLWEGRSLPLGVRGARTGREQGVVQLTGGDRLVLYTDGLVERRDQPLDEALAALVEAAGSLGGAPVNRLVSDAPAHPVGEHDDVCLLALTWFGPEVPGRADEA